MFCNGQDNLCGPTHITMIWLIGDISCVHVIDNSLYSDVTRSRKYSFVAILISRLLLHVKDNRSPHLKGRTRADQNGLRCFQGVSHNMRVCLRRLIGVNLMSIRRLMKI